MQVLLVDGHPATREAMTELITQGLEGLTKLVALERADEAARLLRREPFDLAVVDTLGREVPLDEAVRMLVKAQPGLQVMIMTASPESEETARAVKAGACAVFDKSRGCDAFLEAVRDCLLSNADDRTTAGA